MKRRNIAILLYMAFVITSAITGCGTTSDTSQQAATENAQLAESDETTQSEQNSEAAELEVDPDLPEGAIVDAEYEDLQGLILDKLVYGKDDLCYSLVNIEKKYHLDTSDLEYYLITDGEGKKWQVSGVLPLDFVTGTVNETTQVYSEPDLSSEVINFGSDEAVDNTIVAGEIIDIDTGFEDDEFYHVFWLNEDWDGYIPKSMITLVEGDGFLHGTYNNETRSRNLIDNTCYNWDVNAIGELGPSSSFIVLRSWMYSDYETKSIVKEYGPDEFLDSYFVLTEDGNMGFVMMGAVTIEE